MNTVTISSTALTVKEYKGQRVVTLKEIDEVHQRPEGTARRNFNSNKEHLIEGVDYFVRNPSEAAKEFDTIAPNGLKLITESGYLMLVKSFTDDLSWTVQRELVNSYFRVDATMQYVVQTLAAMQRALEEQQEISKKLLAQLQTPPTVPDEPEQLAFTEHSARALPLNQTRGKKGGKAKTTPLRWFNIRLYNNLYNAYPKTLRELAQEVGVHVVTLRAWRNGRSRPTVNNARKLAAALGVAENELFLE